jgi:hypothetical protein
MQAGLNSKRTGLNRLLRELCEPASVALISESDLTIRRGDAPSAAFQAVPTTRIPTGAARLPTCALPGMPTALVQLLEAATAMFPATTSYRRLWPLWSLIAQLVCSMLATTASPAGRAIARCCRTPRTRTGGACGGWGWFLVRTGETQGRLPIWACQAAQGDRGNRGPTYSCLLKYCAPATSHEPPLVVGAV